MILQAIFLSPQKASDSRKESVVEYIERYNPKRNPDKILTLAGYLKEHRNQTSFQQNDIKALFREAAQLPPANLGRDFRWTISNRWIAPEELEKDGFFVTATGFKVLRSVFSDELVKKSKHKTKNRHRKSSINQQKDNNEQ